MVAVTRYIAFANRYAGQSILCTRTVPFALSKPDQFYHSTGCRGYETLDWQPFLDQPSSSRFGSEGYRSVTPISHDRIVESNQCANCRGKHFALKIVRIGPGLSFSEHTPCLQMSPGMTGMVSLTSSVDMEIGLSPRRLIVSTTRSLSSRERKAGIQVFLDSPTNFPPRSAPVKWWKPNWALDLCLPTAFTISQESISRCFAPFPVRSFSFVSAPRSPSDARSTSSMRTSVSGDHTSTSR